MKKILPFALTLILITPMELLIARETQPTNQDERILIVGYSGAPGSIDFWKKLKTSLFARSKELGVITIDFSSNEFSLEAQRASLERAAEMKVAGMIIGAVNDEVFTSIEVFREKNIPVIAVNSLILSNWLTSIIATDNEKAAKMAGRYILERLQSSGSNARRVVIFCGERENEISYTRASIPQQMLSDAGYDVHVYYSKGWQSKFSVREAITEFSSHGQNIAAVFSCHADASIASVLTAERFGLRPLMVGFDLDGNMQAMIQAGRLDATVAQDPVKIGITGIEEMFKVLKGLRPGERIIEIPARLVTRENVHDHQ